MKSLYISLQQTDNNSMPTPPRAPPPPPAPTPVAGDVDEAVWRAVAGAVVRIPRVNSEVYYFPQGHLEQFAASSAVNNHTFTLMKPWITCKVVSVRFPCDPESDQVYARIRLQPLQQPLLARPPTSGGDEVVDEEDVVSFAKVLTRSDANNGGGFSVPRFCAEVILPQLNFAADPPVQNLLMTDTLGNAWEFRHIYRGTPRRHLLTTGWSKYVNAKKLIAGDSVVFMTKKSTNQLFIGVRKAEQSGREGGKADEAVAAIEDAMRGKPFEVLYYPKAGVSDFVVQAEKVQASLRMQWSAGARVRMAVEADDSKISWIQGVVAWVGPPPAARWFHSPWRMLQVAWDEHEISPRIKNRVSPWEVEYIPLSPLDLNPSKRLRFLNDSGVINPNEIKMADLPPPSTISPIQLPHSSLLALINSPLLPNPPPFPPGMQGARPDHPTANNSTTTTTNTTGSTTVTEDHDQDPQTTQQDRNGVSTVLRIGGSGSNPDVGESSGQSNGGGRGQPPPPSFQLFGTTIQQQPKKPGEGSGGSK